MKKYLILLLFSLSKFSGFSQYTYFSNYFSVPGASIFMNPGVMADCANGNFIGLGNNSVGPILYKIDETGNILWWKQLGFPTLTVAIKAVPLSDSTVAFMLNTVSSPYSVIILKADFNGNIVWVKGLVNSFYAEFSAIAPAVSGGLILSGGGCAGSNMIIHINSSGIIVTQVSHTNYPLAVYDMIKDGNNLFTVCGIGNNTSTYRPFVIFSSNSAGIATNYYELYFTGGMGNSLSSPVKIICRANDGRHYCIFPVSNSKKKFALLCLNSQNQLTWSKYIIVTDTIFNPSQIVATDDLGCVVIGSNLKSTSPLTSLPSVMKFDLSGNLEWSKMMGDTSLQAWRNIYISSIFPTSDSGWISSVYREGTFNICKSDSTFNGFCNYTPFYPTVVDFTPQIVSHVLTTSPINFTLDPVYPSIYSLLPYRFDECTTLGISNSIDNKEFINVFPNPVRNEINIEIHGNAYADIILYDTYSKVYFQEKFVDNIKLNLNNVAQGMYFLDIVVEGRHIVKKIVKE